MTFDSRLKLEFHGAKVTSDAGVLAYRELDEALGLTGLGKNTQHSIVALMRQSLFGRLAGQPAYQTTGRAMHIALTQQGLLHMAKLIEAKQRVIAGAAEMSNRCAGEKPMEDWIKNSQTCGEEENHKKGPR